MSLENGNNNDGESQQDGQGDWLLSQARSYEAKAETAQLCAHKIRAEVEYIRTCLQPIKILHTPQTWDSKAATQSRLRLNGYHHLTLNSLIAELENLAGQLTAYAYIWNTNAQNFLRML